MRGEILTAAVFAVAACSSYSGAPSETSTGPAVDSGRPIDGGGPIQSDAAAPACEGTGTRCVGPVPERCIDGVWTTDPPCAGDKPVCSNGECVQFHVVGAVRAVSPTTADAGVRPTAAGFGSVRVCTPQNVCVTGGVQP